jgi:large repetitive protein
MVSIRSGRCWSVLIAAAACLATNGLPAAAAPPSQPAAWSLTGSLRVARGDQPAVLLLDGQVLVAGGLDAAFTSLKSAELYDPTTRSWSLTGDMVAQTAAAPATVLPDGDVLVAGGCHGGSCGTLTKVAQLYDPAEGTWSATGSLPSAREDGTATLLTSGALAGDVLLAGGCCLSNNDPLASALLYDPSTGRWSTTGSMAVGRLGASATLLPSGEVLVEGGEGAAGAPLASAELYDPATQEWTATGSMGRGRTAQSATLLPNGTVLVAGGCCIVNGGLPIPSAEIYTPSTGRWTPTGKMANGRWDDVAVLLKSGTVLVAGGCCVGGGGEYLASAELYTPSTGKWTTTASMQDPRADFSANLLPDGRVLVEGSCCSTRTAELYTPATG